MGLFDFLKAKPSPPSPAASGDLVFKSPVDAMNYVQSYMKTDWKPRNVVIALLDGPTFKEGCLSASLLIPQGEGVRLFPSHTMIRDAHGPDLPPIHVDKKTTLDDLGLRHGDLVSVLIAARDEGLAKLMPESEGWILFVVGKNAPCYSMRDQGWRMERKFEL